MIKTSNRDELVTQLRAPYSFMKLEHKKNNDGDKTFIAALIDGAIENVADALLLNPESDFWRNKNPVEDDADGEVIKWFRGVNTKADDAEEKFAAYACVAGCENAKNTARIVRWMIEQNFRADDAIAYTSKKGGYRIDDDFPEYIRERILLGAYPDRTKRAEARKELKNDYND